MLFLLPFLFSSFARAAPAHECGVRPLPTPAENISVRFCVDHPEHPDGDVLYYFHGSGGSEQSWSTNPQFVPVRAGWDRRGRGEPTVISISLGPTWLVSTNHRAEALARLFPLLENGQLKGRRFLMGDSVGGFNAAILMFTFPVAWNRVALLCPALAAVSPFATPPEIEAYASRHDPYVRRDWISKFLEWFRHDMQTPAIWSATDPLTRPLTAPLPPLFISCGRQDEFGFFEGAEKFVARVRAVGRAPSVEWRPLDGDHCTFDPEALAEFFRR